MEENMTYESASKELEAIHNEINNEQVSIDELAGKVKRAALLISFCQKKLRAAQTDISQILADMSDDEVEEV